MDGREDRQRCEPGEEKCDICQQYPAGIKPGAVEEGEECPDEEEHAEDKAQQTERNRREDGGYCGGAI